MITFEQVEAFAMGLGGVLLKALIIIAITAVAARALRKLLNKLLSHDGSPLPSSSIFLNIANVIV